MAETALAATGAPAWEVTALQALSAKGLLNGIDPVALAAVAKNESGFEVNGAGVNGSGYGGYFGLGAGDTYPGGSPSDALLMTNDLASFDTQAEIASSLIAEGASKAGGSQVEGVNYLNLGTTSGALGADASIYQGFLAGAAAPQVRAVSGQMGGPGGNAATGTQTAGDGTVALPTSGGSWALNLQNALNPASSGILGTTTVIEEWGARLGLVAVGLILFLAGLAVVGISSLLPHVAGKAANAIPGVAAIKAVAA